MDTFRTPVPLNVEDSIVDKYFFRAGGSHVSRIQAKVADEYESGTDCIVYLELHNPGTTHETGALDHTCMTGALDGPGNSWARDGSEDYPFEEADNVCINFRPGNHLQFTFRFEPSFPILHHQCFDHMQLTWVRVYFGRYYGDNTKYYEWSGKHWWNPRSNWMKFDFWGVI